MFAKILGIIWIVLGVLWVAKPQIPKERLKRKMARKIKWVVFGFVALFAFTLIGSILKAQGMPLKIVGLIALVVVARTILLVTSKTSEKVSAWWQGRSLVFFRIWGLFFLAMGTGLIFIE